MASWAEDQGLYDITLLFHYSFTGFLYIRFLTDLFLGAKVMIYLFGSKASTSLFNFLISGLHVAGVLMHTEHSFGEWCGGYFECFL